LQGAAAALMLAGLGGALPAEAQSLQDALALAYQNNPTLLAERANLRAQDEGVAQALSGWRPTVTVNGAAGRQWLTQVPSRTGEPSITGWPGAAGITITENLYQGGKTTAQTRAAEFTVLAERANLQLVEQTTLLNAATAYINVVLAQAVLQLNVNNEQVLTTQLEATRDQFAVGEVTRTDVSQAEASLETAKAGRIQAQNQLQVARANYRTVIGDIPGELKDPGEPAGLPPSREDARHMAQRENPNVLVANYNEGAARANIDVQFSGLLPSLSIQGLAQKQQQQFSASDTSEQAIVEAILSVPIYTGGLVDSQVRQAKQVLNQRRLQLEQSQRQAIQDATTFWENEQSARAQIASFEATVAADKIALEGTRQEQQVGLRTVLDVLNAEQALLQAEVNLATARHDAAVAAYNELNAIGHLTARDLRLPVPYFDPTAHYNEVRDQWFGTEVKDQDTVTNRPPAPRAGTGQ